MSLMQGEITANEYSTADDDLSTCFTFSNPSEWRDELHEKICFVNLESEYVPLTDESMIAVGNLKSYSQIASYEHILMHLGICCSSLQNKDTKNSVKMLLVYCQP